MQRDLNTLLYWPSPVPSSFVNPSDYTLLLDANGSMYSASFILTHFMSLALKGDSKQKVVLLGVENSFTHYATVAKKLGLNLTSYFSQKRFTYLNALSSPYPWTDDVLTLDSSYSSVSVANPCPLVSRNSSESPLQALFGKIKNLIAKAPDGVCLIIDDLTLLQTLSFSSEEGNEMDLVSFVHNCASLLSGHKSSNLVIRAHSDALSPSVLAALKLDPSLIIESLPLRTGYSPEVDGVLHFSRPLASPHTILKLPLLHYKLAESHVTLSQVHAG
eukprot:TRINITY_DN3405_c0_g1_i1.p1 TRINITY_DN3405_c0_g1~~TRINITY_DN3405_c0_g1_i1.p1  ORF type:complete len:283 (-),score=65.92 TRINITY_DN3405_c0_g1_i1:105-926(-)